MRLIRVLIAFLLTLILFWVSPPFAPDNSDNRFLEAVTRDFLVDHTVLSRFSGEGSPRLTARVTTPLDTSSFKLLVYCCQHDSTGAVGKIMPRMPGTYDLHALELPALDKGEVYRYHLELHDSTGALLARLPEKPGQEIELRFLGRAAVWLQIAHLTFLFLAAIFAFLALFDTALPRGEDVRLRKLSQKVLAAGFFLLAGGMIFQAALTLSQRGRIWDGWPLGQDLTQFLWALTAIYWIFLTFVFKGTIFGARSQNNLVPAGGAVLLTLLGVLLVVTAYLVGVNV